MDLVSSLTLDPEKTYKGVWTIVGVCVVKMARVWRGAVGLGVGWLPAGDNGLTSRHRRRPGCPSWVGPGYCRWRPARAGQWLLFLNAVVGVARTLDSWAWEGCLNSGVTCVCFGGVNA